MHELSIAQALVDQLLALARQEHATAITQVALSIGSIAGVDPEALRVAFPIAADGTPARGAELVVETVPAQVRCRACETETSPDFLFPGCTQCGSPDVDVIAGREILIQSVELETR